MSGVGVPQAPSHLSLDSDPPTVPSPPRMRPLPAAVVALLLRRRANPPPFTLPPMRPARPIPPKGKGKALQAVKLSSLPVAQARHLGEEREKFVPFFHPEASSSSQCLPLCTCHARLLRVRQCGNPPLTGRKRSIHTFFQVSRKKMHREWRPSPI